MSRNFSVTASPTSEGESFENWRFSSPSLPLSNMKPVDFSVNQKHQESVAILGNPEPNTST